jgi:hypothetical protein
MIPVMPDEIDIDTVQMITMVAAMCRARSPIGGDFREEFLLSDTCPLTKIAPDPVRSLAGHE